MQSHRISSSAKDHALEMFHKPGGAFFAVAAVGRAKLNRAVEFTLVYRNLYRVSNFVNNGARIAEQLVGRDKNRSYAEQREHASKARILAHE